VGELPFFQDAGVGIQGNDKTPRAIIIPISVEHRLRFSLRVDRRSRFRCDPQNQRRHTELPDIFETLTTYVERFVTPSKSKGVTTIELGSSKI
jgi:hypothetical protein